ncbi:MAG: hypothetical protein HZB40_10850 [Rhodocyclales bacterium]|nr:hypothetical protein [Rhodocyclales bacterium]
MKPVSLFALAAAGALGALPALAADAGLQALREEIAQMRKSYEQRIEALEKRLVQAEATSTQARVAADQAANQTTRAGEGKANAFNPEIGLNLQGALTKTTRDPATWTMRGFVPPGEPDEIGPPRRRGFTAQETELTVAANVDPNFRGYLNLALTPGNAVELEEAYFHTLGLGAGLTVKGGRFLSGIGYQNEIHPHAWDFADAPLAYTAFVGNKLTAEGLQLKWLAPTESFLELGLEAGRDNSFPGGARNKGGSGLGAAFAHIGGDVGASSSWRGGLSYIATRPGARSYAGVDASGLATTVSFAGDSRTAVADFVWKWAPDGNAKERSFKLQGEYFHRTEDGRLSCVERDTSGACGGAAGRADSYRSTQSGYYLQGVWQFMPRWRLGYRHDRLDSGTPSFGPTLVATDLPQLASWKPQRNTLMADYATSEFARLRFQLARDSSRGAGLADNQVWLQYVMSLGAHGAHKF